MPASDTVMNQFREAFRLESTTVIERRGWAISVRPKQITLGSMVVSSTSGHLDFQELSGDEAAGLAAAFADVERLAKDELGAVRINLACLMMKDPVVHFHVVPRYDGPVERYGRSWSDADWPGPPSFGGEQVGDALLQQLRDDLRRAL